MKILPLLALLLTTPSQAQWSQWRGPDAAAIIARFAPPTAWPETAQTLWRTEIGGGDGSPVVAAGRAYTLSRQGDQEVVSALDLHTGEILWQDHYGPIDYTIIWPGADARGKGPFATPALAAGRLFTYGMQQTLSAYDAASGALLWRQAFDKTLDFGTSASPLIVGDLCVVHVGTPKEGALMALDVANGETRWRQPYDGPSYATPLMTTLHGTRQLVVLSAKYLAGIDPASGEILWQIDVPHPWNENISMPVQIGDLFVLSAVEQGIRGIRVSRDNAIWNATQVWHHATLATYTSSPVAKDGIVYGLAHQRKGHFFALDPLSGQVLWQSPGRQGEFASLLVAGERILALDDDGELSAFAARPDSFASLGSSHVAPTATWAHPNIFGDSLLVKDIGTLALVRLTAGEPTAATVPPPTSAPPPIEITEITWEQDGAAMVLIPAGPFAMGSANGDLDERPVRRVHVDGFYIDRCEVTNAQYRRFVDATGHRHPQSWTSPDYNRPEQPVVAVTWRDAMAYAAWAGKRLPTEAEWEKAARGGLPGRLYPWGDEPPVADSTYRANFEFAGAAIRPGYKQTYPVGTFAPNRYGLYDMAGNVWEWLIEPYVEDAYATLPDRNPVVDPVDALIAAADSTDRPPVFRGGSYQDYDHLLRVANRNHRPPDWDSSSIGFRTVAPAP